VHVLPEVILEGLDANDSEKQPEESDEKGDVLTSIERLL